jgi:hypothetical protein
MQFDFKRIVVRGAFIVASVLPCTSGAADFTDIWYLPRESGWGVNIVQSEDLLFATFFIYGSDNQPAWYTALLTWDGTRYSGGLYATQGTFWANPWTTSNDQSVQAGTASFEPDAGNAYEATLVYTANGIGSVSKRIVRQSLKRIVIGGSYIGAQAGSYSSCSESEQNASYRDTYALSMVQPESGPATLTFTYASGATCTLSGTLQQRGQLYDMPAASYVCAGSLAFTTTATLFEMKATAQGFEGRLSAALPSGCRENANFSAVLL